MATTQQILDEAKKLGELIAGHDAAQKLERLLDQLQNDTEAQRVMTDYDRQAQAVATKQAEGRPIEVEDKRKLESLQKAVIKNQVLRDLQTAQMDYVDLMRKVEEAMQTGPESQVHSP